MLENLLLLMYDKITKGELTIFMIIVGSFLIWR